jgi:ketosteroid isomerase-like protein
LFRHSGVSGHVARHRAANHRGFRGIILDKSITMTFRETLDRHLAAIRARDLSGLIDTLPQDELTLVTSQGELVRDVGEFIAMHRGWFAATTWTLDAEIVSLLESPEIGTALLLLDYRDEPAGQAPVREKSYLSLIFARRDGRWVMIHDQNTPIRPRSETPA